jgi:cation transport ATPase
MRDHHDRGGRHDHSSHHRMMIRDFRRRFFVSMGLTLPILALSPAVQGILGYTLSFPFSLYLLFALATSVSARNGLLIRNCTAFENARRITTVLLDKTGTLTRGNFAVSSIDPVEEGMDRKRLIRLAASLEQNSEHPIARGFADRAREMGLELEEVSDFEAIRGRGVRGVVDGQEIRVASPGSRSAADVRRHRDRSDQCKVDETEEGERRRK